jgi:hypothetical protein
MQRSLIPKLFGCLNDAADLLDGTRHYDTIMEIMRSIDEQATDLVWEPHFGSFYKAAYKDKWLIVRLINSFTFDKVEYVILGEKFKGTARNIREAEIFMMNYVDDYEKGNI